MRTDIHGEAALDPAIQQEIISIDRLAAFANTHHSEARLILDEISRLFPLLEGEFNRFLSRVTPHD